MVGKRFTALDNLCDRQNASIFVITMINKELLVGITGCTGVLGRILTSKLGELGIPLDCFSGDISDPNQVSDWVDKARPNRVIHFAALVPTDQVDSNPGRALAVNVFGTSNLLSAIEEIGISPWIFVASTSHVYASQNKEISENSPLGPITNYGKTKRLAEEIAEYFRSTSNQRICIGRIFSFYHKFQKKPFLYPSILERLEDHDPQEPFELRGAENIRDISNAEEVVDKILKLMNLQYEGIINIGKGSGITIREFVESVSKNPLNIVSTDNSNITRLVADTSQFEKVTNGK